jgi:hypothetical protein
VDLDEIVHGGDDIQRDVNHSKIASEVVQLFNRLVNLDEILYGGDDIEGNHEAIFFNIISSTIP